MFDVHFDEGIFGYEGLRPWDNVQCNMEQKLMCHGKYINVDNHLVVQKGNKSKNKSQVSC
jgi:hypothetical protein